MIFFVGWNFPWKSHLRDITLRTSEYRNKLWEKIMKIHPRKRPMFCAIETATFWLSSWMRYPPRPEFNFDKLFSKVFFHIFDKNTENILNFWRNVQGCYRYSESDCINSGCCWFPVPGRPACYRKQFPAAGATYEQPVKSVAKPVMPSHHRYYQSSVIPGI